MKVPLKITLYYYLLHGSGVLTYLDAGIGYYRGKLSEQFNFDDINGISGAVDWTKTYWETRSKSSLGLHIGQGVEILLLRNLSLIGEIQWRYAKIGNLWATNRYETSYPSYEVSDGHLWYLTGENLFIWGTRIADLMVSEVNPAELYTIYFYADVRKAKIDASALSIKIGLRLKLF